MFRKFLLSALPFILLACGGGGGGSGSSAASEVTVQPSGMNDQQGVTSDVTNTSSGSSAASEVTVQPSGTNDQQGVTSGVTDVTITSSINNLSIGESYELAWTIQGNGECSISGAFTDTVNSDGTAIAIAENVGTTTTTIDCGAVSDSSSVKVIPEFIEISDEIFADALTRLGFDISGGLMTSTDALSVKRLCITSRVDSYGAGDEFGTATFENINVPDGGVTCVYTPNGEYIENPAGLEYFLNLETMRLEHQKVTSLDLALLNNLFFLSLWGNPLQELDLSGNDLITHLGISETSLFKVDTSQLANLEEAAFQNTDTLETPYSTASGNLVNGLTEIDFSKNQNLQRVYLHGNPLKNFGIASNASSLRELWAKGTAIENLDLTNYAQLNYIILNNSEQLEYLNLYGVNGGSVPFRFSCENCPNLTEIVVSDVESWEEARGKDEVFFDDHIRVVEGP